MPKWFSVLLVCLFTISLLAVGGLLPGCIAAWQDRASIGTVSYAQIGAIRLELRQELSVFEKLSLLVDQNTVETSEKDAATSQATLLNIVEQNLQPYQDAGLLFFDIQHAEWIATPYLAYAGSPLQSFSIFWVVNIHSADSPWQDLTVTVDDETGKIMTLEYTCEDSYPETGSNSETPLCDAELLWSVYSDGLGLDASALEASYTAPDEETLFCDLSSADYGTLRIILTAQPNYLSCSVCSPDEFPLDNF